MQIPYNSANGVGTDAVAGPQVQFLGWLTGGFSSLWKNIFDSDHDDSGRKDWILIASNLVGKTSHQWTIGKNVPDATDYKVIAELVDYPAIFSEGPQFTIKEAIVTVNKPAKVNGKMEDIVEGTGNAFCAL